MATSVSLTFPDGSVRDYDAAMTGAALAESISKSLAKKAVAYAIDGTVRDLSDPLGRSGKVEIVTRDDPRALELIRHDTAHVLAEAVQELWPGTQVTIGPVIENGFYYDFARNEPFTPEDFPVIEKKMREIIGRNRPFTQGGLGPRARASGVPRQGRGLQGRADRRDPRRPGPQDLLPGRLVRSLPRPAHGLDGPDRQRLQADEGGRRLLARRRQQPDADAHLRHRLGATRSSSTPISTCWRRPRSATTASSAARWTCSTSRRRGRASCSGTPRAGRCSRALITYMRRRLGDDYEEVNAPQVLDKSLWETSGHWGWYRENMFTVKSAHAFTDRKTRMPTSASSR